MDTQGRGSSLPMSAACQTYATAIAGPSFGASWIPDLERACLGVSGANNSAGSSAFPAPTAVVWSSDPLRPTPA